MKLTDGKQLFCDVQKIADAFSKKFFFPRLESLAVLGCNHFVIILFQRQLHPWETMLSNSQKPLTVMQEQFAAIQEISSDWACQEWSKYVSTPVEFIYSFEDYSIQRDQYTVALAFFRQSLFDQPLQYETLMVDTQKDTLKTEFDLNAISQTFRKELKSCMGRGAAKCYVQVLSERQRVICFIAEGVLSEGQKEMIREKNIGQEHLKKLLETGFVKSMHKSVQRCSQNPQRIYCSAFLEHDRVVGYWINPE